MSDTVFQKDIIPYNLLVEENETGIFYLQNDKILYANKKFSEIIGLKAVTDKPTSLISFIHKTDQLRLRKNIKSLVNGEEEIISDHFELPSEDQIRTFISLHLKVQVREKNKAKIIGASRISTARVSNLAKLTKIETQLNVLYNNVQSGIMIYNYNNESITEFNPTALEIFGYDDPDEFLSLDRFEFVPQFSQYFPGLDLHKMTNGHADIIRKGEAFNVPGVFLGKNNKEIIVRANLVPTERSKGEAFIIFNDITKEYRANKIIKEAEKKYKDIIENSQESIVYLNANSGVPTFCNANILDLFGVNTLEEFAKLRPSDFIKEDPIEGVSAEKYYAGKIKEALKNGKSEATFWLTKITGERIRVSGNVISNNNDDEEPTVICFFRDITTLYEFQINLNKKNTELKKYIESNLQLENFAYFASHDLQTPLRSIISFTQLLNKKLGDKITVVEQQYMDFIISSSMNMKNLVVDILSYSKANAENINLKNVDVKRLIFELESEFKSDSEQNQINFSNQDLPLKIKADPIKIRQIFSNLISNAIKFSSKDNIPEIVISSKEQKKHWLFSVQDNGIGIEKQFQENIFLLFKSLHPKSEYQGTGIGLALVKKLVEQHNGNIWVDSKIGKGTTFYFTVQKF